MNFVRPSRGNQAAAFICAACGIRRSFADFGAGVGIELMPRGEAAPICTACADSGIACPAARDRIECDIRRRSCEPGGVPDRVLILDPEFCALWDRA